MCQRCAQPPPPPARLKPSDFDPYVSVKYVAMHWARTSNDFVFRYGSVILAETPAVEQMSVASWPLSLQFNFFVKEYADIFYV